MMHILDDANEQYFEQKYPVIYKNKIKKKNSESYYFNSPIDIALKSNQVRAVDKMIEYIVKYQNSFVSSYLFVKNLPRIISKDIKIYSLLNSDIFQVEFDFDEWPGHHTNGTECIRGYQKSFFALRSNYETVFWEDEWGTGKDMHMDNTRIYKTKYSVNLLPLIGFHVSESGQIMNENTSLMDLAANSDELAIFQTESLKTLI